MRALEVTAFLEAVVALRAFALEEGGAGVEVELTPNITVESEVTGSGASKSGVRFQWDY